MSPHEITNVPASVFLRLNNQASRTVGTLIPSPLNVSVWMLNLV